MIIFFPINYRGKHIIFVSFEIYERRYRIFFKRLENQALKYFKVVAFVLKFVIKIKVYN